MITDETKKNKIILDDKLFLTFILYKFDISDVKKFLNFKKF